MNDTSDINSKSKEIESQQQPKTKAILRVKDCSFSDIQSFLKSYQLELHLINNNQSIPGSFWGDSEAGLVSNKIYVREDTPIHSLLHETCHYICMDETRRENLNTNAKGSYDEENAVCYLQILLAKDFPEMDSNRMMQDMDIWGYTFRLGSAKNWFENDAEDALKWLQSKELLDAANRSNYTLRVN